MIYLRLHQAGNEEDEAGSKQEASRGKLANFANIVKFH